MALTMNPENRDAQLMREVASRQALAVRELVSRVMGRVQFIANRILRGQAEVADVAQTAIVEIIRSAESYRPVGRLESWADRIAVHVSMRARQERWRSTAVSSDVLESLAGDAEPASVFSESVPRDVKCYLEQLPAGLSHVLVMRHVMDFSAAEIAEAMGVPLGTVKDRLLRAHEAVEKMIRRDQLIGVRRLKGAV